VVTRGHSWSLVVTRGHTWSLVVTRGHSWSLVVTHGHSWSLVVTRGHSWSLVVTRGHSWSLVCTFRQDRNKTQKRQSLIFYARGNQALLSGYRKIEHIDKNSRPIGGMETRGMFYYTYSFLNQSTESRKE
jgi:hypothetical protein